MMTVISSVWRADLFWIQAIPQCENPVKITL
jgi:hypothetical protein